MLEKSRGCGGMQENPRGQENHLHMSCVAGREAKDVGMDVAQWGHEVRGTRCGFPPRLMLGKGIVP